MAVLGSLFFNRTLKQFLACADLDSAKGIALTDKVRVSARGSLDRILEIIPDTSSPHRELLQEICLENVEGSTEELFLQNLKNDETKIRSATASILSKSMQISPTKLFKQLHEPDSAKTEIIQVLSFQRNQLKPEQVVSNALKLDKAYAEKLLKLAGESDIPLNVSALKIDPLAIESPSIKISLLRYLAQVQQADTVPLIAKFISDIHRPVVLEALKALKNLNVAFDASVLLPYVETMAEIELELAFEIFRNQAGPELVAKLAPWTCGKSDQIRQFFISIVVQHADAAALQTFLKMLDQQEWWGKDQSVKCLQQMGNEKLYGVAAELTENSNDFIKNNAQQLAAMSLDPADLQKIWDNALHENWQVREPAIVAMGKSGRRESVPQLKKVVEKYPESTVVVLKALTSLGFSKGIEIAFDCLRMDEALMQREALETIGTLAKAKYAQKIRDTIMQAVPKLQATVRDTARDVVNRITRQFELSPLNVNEEEYFDTRLLRIDGEATTQMYEPNGGDVEATKVVSFQNIEELKEGDLWMDRFRINCEIGRGAMGRVMLAADEMVGEPLVLKFMHPELTADGASRERFLREVKYSRRVSHPNVIRIHDMLFKDNLCAISMEFFESKGIDEYLREKTFFEPLEGLQILLQVSKGMAAAHDQQVIHRDLKPSNILMDAKGLVKVVDFGIASASSSTDSTLTKTGSIIGTPAYLSPERAKGYEAQPSCDIYALGIIAYCMLAGQLPYRGEPMSLLFQHLEGKAKPAIEVKKSIGKDVSKLIEQLMAVKASDRIQTMDDVSDSINRIISKIS